MIQAAIFDLDGLMVDSEPISHQAWLQVLAPYGAGLSEQQYQRLIGIHLERSSAIVAQWTGVPLTPPMLAERHDETILNLFAAGLEPMPGLLALIEALQGHGLALGVASNSLTHYVEQALQAVGLRAHFGSLVGVDQVANGKPAPDVFLAAAAGLGVAPERCLAFEDSPIGAQAAVAAGMRCLAIPSAALVDLDFSVASARYDSLADVLPDLERWLGDEG